MASSCDEYVTVNGFLGRLGKVSSGVAGKERLCTGIPWMRVIIFGCGYVGRNLAPAFVEDGHEVWIHSRNPESLEAVVSVPPEHRVAGNLHDEDWHPGLEGDWDVVFNLVSSAGGGIDGYRISYLEGNRSIQKWAIAALICRQALDVQAGCPEYLLRLSIAHYLFRLNLQI